MPRTGSLLTAKEKVRFTEWLRSYVERAVAAGKSKSAIAREALNDDQTTRLNRYIATEGAQIPTAVVLANLSRVIGAPWPTAFLRAGYFREILGVVQLFGFVGTDENHGDEEARGEMREMVIDFAFQAFPRRDVAPVKPFSNHELDHQVLAKFIDADFAPKDRDEIDALTDHLAPLLERAAIALEDPEIAPDIRRAVASEYVNAWADDFDLFLANKRRSAQQLVTQIMEAHPTSKQPLPTARRPRP